MKDSVKNIVNKKNFCHYTEKAMDLIVNDYHQGFSDAIQKFSGVVDNISGIESHVFFYILTNYRF